MISFAKQYVCKVCQCKEARTWGQTDWRRGGRPSDETITQSWLKWALIITQGLCIDNMRHSPLMCNSFDVPLWWSYKCSCNDTYSKIVNFTVVYLLIEIKITNCVMTMEVAVASCYMRSNKIDYGPSFDSFLIEITFRIYITRSASATPGSISHFISLLIIILKKRKFPLFIRLLFFIGLEFLFQYVLVLSIAYKCLTTTLIKYVSIKSSVIYFQLWLY